jgi:hypothetical protein
MRVPALRLEVRRGWLMVERKRPKQIRGYVKPPADLMQAGKEIEKAETKDTPKNRAAAALQLRIDGAGWGDISRVLDFDTPADARMAVENALAVEAKSTEDIEQIRFLEARRMERILASLMRRATNPKDPDHLAYARTAMVVIDRHTKLYGADAPQQLNVTYNPAAGQIEHWVEAMARRVHGEIEEADILDVEVVEDERDDQG